MQEQLSLFWGSNPEHVIGIIQFMQFCYALGLSIILMYWPTLNAGEVAPYIYLVGVLLCYALFLKVMAEVIPQYTLCTSLGQLVNQRHLQEAIALHRLEEHQEIKKLKQMEASIQPLATGINESSNSTLVASPSMGSLSSHDTSKWSGRTSIHQAKLAELVKMDTASLRDNLSPETRQLLVSRDQEKEGRRLRRRNLSDGVSSMRSRSLASCDPAGEVRVLSDDLHVHDRSTTDLFGLSQSASSLQDHTPAASGESSQETLQQVQERRRQERQRRRSISAPTTIASWQATPLAEDTIPETDDKSWEIGSIPGEDGDIIPPELDGSADDNNVIGEAPDSFFGHYTPPALSPDSVDMEDRGPTIFQRLAHNLEPSVIRIHLKDYYLGDLYPTISHIFGTSVCFFLIGMRVESMLSATDVVDSSNNTWELSLGASYWWQFGMYAAFLVNALVILILFAPTCWAKKGGFSHRVTIVAAMLDMVLVLSCMVILYRSEVLRGCSDDDNNNADDEIACPNFGSRIQGGLGNVEPFTSLIALRVFRFATSNYLIKKWWSKNKNHHDASDEPSTTQKDLAAHEFHGDGAAGRGCRGGGDGGGHQQQQHGSMQEERGTALELWERAVKKYPDIVKKHGEFSGELFQAMLGLDSYDDDGGDHGHH